MKSTKTMNKAQLLREKERNEKDQSSLVDQLIALGHGTVLQSELVALGISEALTLSALRNRMYDIREELERIQLGYRKSTPVAVSA